ncbi:hypothetical protein WKH56_20245 [Priestia sp. SB1]|uniref:hypothetical protein n=1 Tax=Priestia sp. SB1 TaxID=3132359 RepID=UPI003174FE38
MKNVDYIKLDYDKLLDEWAEILFKDAEEYEKKRDQASTDSYAYGYFAGKHDGVIQAIAKLSILETRKARKYIKEIVNKEELTMKSKHGITQYRLSFVRRYAQEISEEVAKIEMVYHLSEQSLIDEKVAENYISGYIRSLEEKSKYFKGYIR